MGCTGGVTAVAAQRYVCMNAAMGARLLFGASAVLFGAITLIWRDAGTWQGSPILSLGSIVAGAIAVAQIAGGIGLPYPRTARTAAIVLAVIYALFVLGCIPGIVAAPTTYGSYVNFFEWLAVVSGAVAAYGFANAARVVLGLCTISFALAQIAYFRFTASLVPTWIPPSPAFWTVLTTIAFALAAIAILLDRFTGLAIRLMTLMLALFGILIWIPAVVTHPSVHGNWSELALNFLITGAAWLVGVAVEQRNRERAGSALLVSL